MAKASNGTAAKSKKKEKVGKIHIDPTINFVLTAIFLGQILFSFYMLKGKPDDIYLLGILHALVVIAIFSTKGVARMLGGWFSRTYLPGDPLQSRKTMKKFCDQSWQLMIHVSVTIGEVYILYYEDGGTDYATDTKKLWDPHPSVQPVTQSLRYMYLSQLAIWIVTCISHRFIEEHHKDYFLMYAHHVVTIFLISFSWDFQYIRIGLLVLICHDSSDIVCDLLKMFNYMQLEGPRGLFLTEIAFVTNLFTWAYIRLWIYPRYVVYSAWYESRYVLSRQVWIDEGGGEKYGFDADGNFDFFRSVQYEIFPKAVPMGFFLPALLSVLAVMHVFWFMLFLRMLYRMIVTSAHEAGASEYEGDSDDSSTEEDDKNTNNKKEK
eukprot:m.114403 g.114403  ORF g.114403 m.114403 type:complete len:378 (-) comp28346_c1_seq1:401-1534(-)